MMPFSRSGVRRFIAFSVVAGLFGPRVTAGQSYFPPVKIDENANFMQTISTGGAAASYGLLLICEGEPTPKADIPTGSLAWMNLCGNTLPGFGISDIVAFLPSPGGIFIQMASDADGDTDLADITPLPGPFINTNITAITEQVGPSGFIEYAPDVGQPGFFTNGPQFPLYEIQSDCLPAPEHFASCSMPAAIAPQCGDPGGECGMLTGQDFGSPEPETWALMLTGLAVMGGVGRRRSRAVRFSIGDQRRDDGTHDRTFGDAPPAMH